MLRGSDPTATRSVGWRPVPDLDPAESNVLMLPSCPCSPAALLPSPGDEDARGLL
jgi:hypothetical protein